MTPPTSSHRIRRWLTIGFVVLLAAAAVWWLKQPKPVAVAIKEVDKGRVSSTIANTRAGTVEACLRTKLSTILGGRIEVLAVKEGDHVSKGQLLMKLWNDDQQAQSALARTQLTMAQKRVGETCILADNAEREAERQANLRAKGFVSASAEETARAGAQSRRASCETAKADVNQSVARVRAIKVEQGRTVLYAPFAGTVAKIVGEVGEFSTPSPPGVPMPPAIDLIDESCLYIKAPMDEVDAPKIRPGQPVRITLDALPKQSFAGHVKRVAPYVSAVEKQARTVDIEAVFDQPEATGKLLVGYSADIEVILAVRDDVVRLPTQALLEGGKVLVVRADGVLEERKIKAGLSNWEYSEVLEGIKAGERVVISLEREGVKAGVRVVADEKNIPAGK
ncbi:MAG: efflux RND transporter periplasmic adaptor subunit [Betaproteobacteria bacterium]|nr:efflux RND transporter periplasmic adaptor subunit [Betaproteobacteria bacterium]